MSDQEFLSVSGLNRLVSQSLAMQFPALWVRGEIGQLTLAASGHAYLTLKDVHASVRAVMFRRELAALGFMPKEGDQVEVQASVGLYEPRGEFQLRILAMRQAGQGGLYERFLQLKARLEAEGLFDPAKRMDRPQAIARVGLVTSLAGAALRDFLVTLRRQAPRLQVSVYASLVQGQEAPSTLLKALAEAREDAQRGRIQALAMVRGGGSLEDLWAFNDEALVRAVAALPVYVVSGVGHETDTTLVDFVADHRAATPTAAAEWLAQGELELLQAVDSQIRNWRQRMQGRLQTLQQTVDVAARGLRNPREVARLREQQLLQLARAWRAQSGRLRDRFGARLEATLGRFSGLHPLSVLSRGYAMVVDESGRPIVSAAQSPPGAEVGLLWSDGQRTGRLD